MSIHRLAVIAMSTLKFHPRLPQGIYLGHLSYYLNVGMRKLFISISSVSHGNSQPCPIAGTRSYIWNFEKTTCPIIAHDLGWGWGGGE